MTLLQRTGTITMVGNSVAGLHSPVFGALLICATAALTSAFASSAGILGALIPLSVPLLRTGEVGVAGFIIALAISTTVVDSTPFSNVGAVVLAVERIAAWRRDEQLAIQAEGTARIDRVGP